jgi:hypothetical protein
VITEEQVSVEASFPTDCAEKVYSSTVANTSTTESPPIRGNDARGDESRRPKEGAMALLEGDAIRLADALDDYEHVSVIDLGGGDRTVLGRRP